MALEHTPIFPINGLPQYAYVSAIKVDYPEMAKKVEDSLLANKNLIGLTITKRGNTGVALRQLEDMIRIAKEAELKFLTSHGFSDGGEDWSSLIKGINSILGSEDSFNRALNLLENVANSDNKTKEFKSVDRFLIGYLKEEVYNAFNDLSVDADLGEVAQRAIEKGLARLKNISEIKTDDGKIITLNRKPKENEEIIQAFQSLYDFTHLEKNNPFFQKLKDLFRLEEYVSNVQQQLKEKGRVENKDRLSIKPVGGIKRYHGTLSEILDEGINREVNSSGGNNTISWRMKGKQVGGKNFKADVIIADETLVYDYEAAANQASMELPNSSTRQKGIRTMEILFEQLKDAKGSLVILSNKDYIINEIFETGNEDRLPGFSAQTPANLNNLDKLLSTVGMGRVDNLINYLANAGDGMLLDLDENILRVIAARVADFLFDDMSITPPSGLNVVHVFNLSGIYTPLSFILQGVAAGLRNVETKMQDSTYIDNFVNVNFKQGPTTAPPWSPNAWVEFREERQRKTFIEVHFLQGFAEEISKIMFQ